uniref:Class III homeodomain-leucine zipper protein n=1 Tax=Thelypteris nipponica TaxID=2925009 RepID=A0A2S1CVJ8_9MONI|nr:class III homeodomain-leucine zipper protein [Coryphopteris nipponica]
MGSSKGKEGKLMGDSGKYARYTPEQVEILERVYNDCPKPSSSRRQQLIRDCPILTNIGQKQLKVWFQNRRCREKQRKETGRLQHWNSKLNAMNQMLLEENERLQKQAAQLILENQYLRQQLQLQHPHVDLNQQAIVPTTDTSSESVVTSGQHQHSPHHASQEWSVSQLSAVAEKLLAEFLTKATGGMVDGIPLPGMKPGPVSIGAMILPSSGGHVTAQACGFVDLGVFKVADIIKNRPSWLQDCRKQDIIASFPADHGGLVELVHTQMYAPTTSVAARDFWTLRYTCLFENGNLVVCEGSLAAGQGAHEIPSLPGFVRAEMLPSGCLIRPCEQGGSMAMVIDDMNFLTGNLTEGLRPLYDTSALLAWRVTLKVLSYLRGLPKDKVETGFVNNPTPSLQGFSHRLVRGFNDALNCFPDDGWVSMINDGPGSTVSVHIKPAHNCVEFGATGTGAAAREGTICAKAFLLLHSLPPNTLVSFLKERWMAWADLDVDISLEDLFKTSVHDDALKGKFSSVKVIQPVAAEQNEVLEVVRLQKPPLKGEDVSEVDSFLLQLNSAMEDASACAYAQLLFAPIDASVPDDSPLLPSGFRIMHLDVCPERIASSQTLDLALSLEDQPAPIRIRNQSSYELGSALTIAFQYVYKAENHDVVALKAQQSVQALVDLLQQAAVSLHPRPSPLVSSSQFGTEAVLLVQQLADSYRAHIGRELLPCTDGSSEGLFKAFWNLKHAIVCCAWKPLPEFIFANHAALEMLESSLFALREMSLERMFNDGYRKTDYSQPPPFLQKEGFACLPAGVCLMSTGRPVSFERATGWKVIVGDPSVRIAAFVFCNWSFVGVQL